ncbi:unnamed protein product [Oppiella nova]|uniref:C2H2-type domain-containing protein n=1 Tax=Oppiella nova TaxID=334625 RepID=A0A7R9MEI9_9ACAR|nr:unnamed protein product [Oppiella nova]CAG2175865.1 unnamed protein product [Oppiella nova]
MIQLNDTIVNGNGHGSGTAQKGRKYQNSHQTCHSCCAADKPYICDWQNCGKRFRKKPHLDTHKNIHTGRRFPCDWPNCGKSFVRKYNLIEHRKLHSSVNPNVCEFANCGKFFSSNCTSFSYLSYSCPKSLQYSIFLASVIRIFREWGLLDRYLKIHRLVKYPYCTVCDEGSKYSLMRHQSVQHSQQ